MLDGRSVSARQTAAAPGERDLEESERACRLLPWPCEAGSFLCRKAVSNTMKKMHSPILSEFVFWSWPLKLFQNILEGRLYSSTHVF